MRPLLVIFLFACRDEIKSENKAVLERAEEKVQLKEKAVETPAAVPAAAMPTAAIPADARPAPGPKQPMGRPPVSNGAKNSTLGPLIQPGADGSLPTFTTQNLANFEEQDAKGTLKLPPGETKMILDALALQPGQAVADVGCGPGIMLYPLADQVGDSGKVYAVDVDPEAITYVKRRLSLSQERYGRTYPQVQAVQNTLQDVGLPQKSADAILLRHIQNYITVPPGNATCGPEGCSETPLELKARGESGGEEHWIAFITKTQRNFTRSMHASLRPGGKLLIIDRSRMPNGVLGMDGVKKVIEAIGGFRLMRSFSEWADPTDWALLYERVD